MPGVNLLTKLWDDASLAEFLGVPVSWVASRARAGEIPCIQYGRYRRYDPESEAFKQWLASPSIKPENPAHRQKDGSDREDQSMTRYSYQRGRIEQRQRKHGTVWVLRYRLRTSKGWMEKTEELAGCLLEKDARAAADKRMVAVNRINNGDVAITFKEFIDTHWSEHLKKLKTSTAKQYASIVKAHLLAQLSDRLLTDIKPADITKIMSAASRTRKGNGLKDIYVILKLMFEIALQYDLIENNPVRPKLHRPGAVKIEKVALTAEEVAKVIAAAKDDHQAILICCALTGMRVGELLGLRWMDVDLERRVIAIRHTYWRGHLQSPKTEASRRNLHIPQALFNSLMIHHAKARSAEPVDYVFAKPSGKPYCYSYMLESVLKPALKAAGITRVRYQHGFHLFRHSVATILDSEAGSMRLARDLLGHAQESTTALYTHTPRVTVDAIEIVAEKVLGSCGLTVAQTTNAVQ